MSRPQSDSGTLVRLGSVHIHGIKMAFVLIFSHSFCSEEHLEKGNQKV